MRHLRSILYALVLSAAAWLFLAAGLTSRGRDGIAVHSIADVLLLILGGIAYGILLFTPISPAGPLLMGAVFLGLGIWSVEAPAAYAASWHWAALGLPGHALAVLLAVPMMLTALSARRWARFEPPVLLFIGTIGRPPTPAFFPGTPPSAPVFRIDEFPAADDSATTAFAPTAGMFGSDEDVTTAFAPTGGVIVEPDDEPTTLIKLTEANPPKGEEPTAEEPTAESNPSADDASAAIAADGEATEAPVDAPAEAPVDAPAEKVADNEPPTVAVPPAEDASPAEAEGDRAEEAGGPAEEAGGPAEEAQVAEEPVDAETATGAATEAETPAKEAEAPPEKAEPVDAEPTDAEPVAAEPADAEPTIAEPTAAEPVAAEAESVVEDAPEDEPTLATVPDDEATTVLRTAACTAEDVESPDETATTESIATEPVADGDAPVLISAGERTDDLAARMTPGEKTQVIPLSDAQRTQALTPPPSSEVTQVIRRPGEDTRVIAYGPGEKTQVIKLPPNSERTQAILRPAAPKAPNNPAAQNAPDEATVPGVRVAPPKQRDPADVEMDEPAESQD